MAIVGAKIDQNSWEPKSTLEIFFAGIIENFNFVDLTPDFFKD